MGTEKVAIGDMCFLPDNLRKHRARWEGQRFHQHPPKNYASAVLLKDMSNHPIDRRNYIKYIGCGVAFTSTASTVSAQSISPVVLPPDSSYLLRFGEINRHDFAESSFTEDDLGKSLNEFDFTTADTSNVVDMRGMFASAESFDQDIGGWNTSNVEYMGLMFYNARSFDQDIGEWDTSNVKDMYGMFESAESFDQDISGWDTSNVETMSSIFDSAESFNQDLSGWCVENIDEKPNGFDTNAGFEDEEANQPNWGEPC